MTPFFFLLKYHTFRDNVIHNYVARLSESFADSIYHQKISSRGIRSLIRTSGPQGVIFRVVMLTSCLCPFFFFLVSLGTSSSRKLQASNTLSDSKPPKPSFLYLRITRYTQVTTTPPAATPDALLRCRTRRFSNSND